MSRGPGKIQRFILDELQAPGAARLMPVVTLAGDYANRHQVEYTSHLRASFRRAAWGMLRKGEVRGFHLPLPTRFDKDLAGAWSMRKVLCITLPDAQFTDDDPAIDGAVGLMAVADGMK